MDARESRVCRKDWSMEVEARDRGWEDRETTTKEAVIMNRKERAGTGTCSGGEHNFRCSRVADKELKDEVVPG
mgnify:CR=1 FL=1